jgi:hypothetical protein
MLVMNGSIHNKKGGLSLLVIAAAQLMLVLDDAIANIALPSIQKDLAVPAGVLPWIVTAYVLTFGGLLLFGGRLGACSLHIYISPDLRALYPFECIVPS